MTSPADREISSEVDLAERSKREYLWPEAAGAYQRAVDLARRAGDVESAVLLERELALCHLRSAFQSANKAAFLSGMETTEAAYLRAIESSRSLADPLRLAFSAQLEGDLCLARSLHSGGSDERRRFLRQSSRSRRDALERFKELGREQEALAATLDHLDALVNELNMEWSPPRRLAIIAEGLEVGAEALGAKTTTEHGRAWMCYSMGVLMHRQVYLLDDAAAKERAKKESIEYATKAVELSGTTGDRFLVSRAHLSAISAINYGGRSRELFKRYLAASLESANATRDARLTADVLAATAYDLTWDMLSEEIPERLTSKFEECKRLVGEAAEKYDAVACEEGAAAAYGSSLVLAYYRASLGVDKARKSELLEDAARIGTKALDSFARSGCIGFEGPIDNTPAQNLGYVLIEQALLSDGKRRKALFAEAARLSGEVLRYRESFEPFNKWDKGIDLDTEASIQVELSRMGTSRQERVDLLRAAAAREREAMRLCKLHFAQSEFADVMAVAMASVSNRIYHAYHELYDLTGEKEARDAMTAALKEVAGLYERAGQPSRAAQAHWRMGQLWDRDGAYVEASDEFSAASRLFDSAAKATQQFGEYFADYSRYMKAWFFISEARAKTRLQDYEQASRDYSSSSELLGSTRRWRHACSYFDAWARLQVAEAHSAGERFSDAIRAFDDARDLFSSGGRTADREADSQIVTVEEALDVSTLGSIRKRYCEGRAALESARKFDAEGEKPRSASQFAAASSIFGEMASDVGPGSERDEFRSMSLLCRGWKLLKEGEMNRSGALFAEGARAFEEASRLRVTERVALVATANSNYCEAMREGLEFGEKGDEGVYAGAKRHLEAARSGYADAELHRDATWTEVAMSVLDARLYLFKGEATTNPVERVKLYAMTEKSLASALSLAEGAGYRSRVIPVEKELSRLRRKAAVAQDLAQMIAAPPISAPGALVQAQPTEEASGLAVFERVNLQGQLRHEGQVEIGETFEVQLDVFNSGSQPASLLRVEEMAPGGLKLVSAQEPYLIEEATLDTRERLVQPLRIQSFLVSLMAQDAGEKTLSPRLVYRDQVGRVSVLPLLGTSVRVLPHSVFEFRTPAAKLVFDSLVKEFVKDYMHDKLGPEQAGWRSRGQVEKAGKVPKSALYEAPGKYGSPLYELLSRGLVESRTFRRQRGRGGEATKLRIIYNNEVVKRYVDRWVKSKR